MAVENGLLMSSAVIDMKICGFSIHVNIVYGTDEEIVNKL
jgi:hypothetical protein